MIESGSWYNLLLNYTILEKNNKMVPYSICYNSNEKRAFISNIKEIKDKHILEISQIIKITEDCLKTNENKQIIPIIKDAFIFLKRENQQDEKIIAFMSKLDTFSQPKSNAMTAETLVNINTQALIELLNEIDKLLNNTSIPNELYFLLKLKLQLSRSIIAKSIPPHLKDDYLNIKTFLILNQWDKLKNLLSNSQPHYIFINSYKRFINSFLDLAKKTSYFTRIDNSTMYRILEEIQPTREEMNKDQSAKNWLQSLFLWGHISILGKEGITLLNNPSVLIENKIRLNFLLIEILFKTTIYNEDYLRLLKCIEDIRPYDTNQ